MSSLRQPALSQVTCLQPLLALVPQVRGAGITALPRALHGCDGAHDQTLGKLLVTHEVFGFEWHGVHWVPMVQFDLRDMSIRPQPQRVVAELAEVFDGWALAIWFSQPNHWLRHRKPVDGLDTRLGSVLYAAHADRFIASG